MNDLSTSTNIAPAHFAQRALFDPVAALLMHFPEPGLPDLVKLNALLREINPAVTSGGGQPIRFVPAGETAFDYEARIHASGNVPTRANDWHDFFNALAWCVWPKTKAACNALHVREQHARRAAGAAGRGPLRDALTQFDECGILVVSSAPEIPSLLAAHEWEAAFWQQRTQLQETTRFLILGHGLWDQLRTPFFGLCAKAIFRTVDPAWLDLPETEKQTDSDTWLARHFSEHAHACTPRSLTPLPLLGIPGVTTENESVDYYRDTRQFRPRKERKSA